MPKQLELTIRKRSLLVIFLTVGLYFSPFLARAVNPSFSVIFQVAFLSVALLAILGKVAAGRITKYHVILAMYLIGFMVLSLAGGLHPGFWTSLISSIIFAKMIIIWGVAHKFKIEDLRPAVYVLASGQMIGVFVGLVDPDFFNSFLQEVGYARDEGRFVGFLLNANRSAAISGLLVIYFLFFDRRFYLFGLFLVVLLLSESRSLTVLTLAIVLYGSIQGKKLSLGGLFAIFISVLGAVFASFKFFEFQDSIQKISHTLGGEGLYIRAAMLSGGVYLAGLFFPFGAGGGSFGSSLSQGSYAYELVGIGNWETVTKMTGVFDSGIGAILGEYGVAGLVFYSIVIFLLFRYAKRPSLSVQNCVFLTFCVLYMSFFRTVASDVFYSAYFLCLYIIFLEVWRRPDSVAN